MFPHITRAEYRTGYKIWIEFEDGDEGIIDLKRDLDGPIFEPLKEISEFSKFKVDTISRTLVWPNGADLAPEFLKSKLNS